MFEAFQIFAISVASSAKEEAKERALSRAQIRKGIECHANQHVLFSDNQLGKVCQCYGKIYVLEISLLAVSLEGSKAGGRNITQETLVIMQMTREGVHVEWLFSASVMWQAKWEEKQSKIFHLDGTVPIGRVSFHLPSTFIKHTGNACSP